MNAAALIDAKMEGQPFDRILHAVREDREIVSKLDSDHLEFLESMLTEAKKAINELETAVKSDNLEEVKKVSQNFQDIFSMIEDSCSDS